MAAIFDGDLFRTRAAGSGDSGRVKDDWAVMEVALSEHLDVLEPRFAPFTATDARDDEGRLIRR